MKMKRSNLEFLGWGVVGTPQDGVLVQTPGGLGLDVRGYAESDYWGPNFMGPDIAGIVPVYVRHDDGSHWPPKAVRRPAAPPHASCERDGNRLCARAA